MVVVDQKASVETAKAAEAFSAARRLFQLGEERLQGIPLLCLLDLWFFKKVKQATKQGDESRIPRRPGERGKKRGRASSRRRLKKARSPGRGSTLQPVRAQINQLTYFAQRLGWLCPVSSFSSSRRSSLSLLVSLLPSLGRGRGGTAVQDRHR